MSIQFRPARIVDVEQSIPLIYSAAVEAFDYAFGDSRYQAIDFLRSAFQSKGLLGYNNHVVATIEDQVVGIGAFYSGEEFNQLNLENIFQILKFYGAMGSFPVFARCLRIKKLIPPPNRMTEYIADLGVKKDLRGQGIGSGLLKYQLEKAHQRGKKTYSLDVAANNPRAQKLYERLGFHVVEEKEFIVDGKKGPISSIRRMNMAIESA